MTDEIRSRIDACLVEAKVSRRQQGTSSSVCDTTDADETRPR
jgi:hypothetical protein